MSTQDNFIINNGKLIQFLGGTKEVVIPDGVVEIGAGAFHGYDIESVCIPDGVIEIGNNCFNNCKHLKTVIIPASVQKISETAFRDAPYVRIITQTDTYAWRYAQNNNVDSKSCDVVSNSNSPLKSTIVNSGSSQTRFVTDKQVSSGTETTHPTNYDQNQSEQLTEKQLQSFLLEQNKEIEYAKILGCKVGEHPWTMRNNFLGRADRFARRVSHISNQDLLIRIASEAQVLSIKCAAIQNITIQEILIQYAKHSSPEIRLSAICNLEDQKTLVHLATNDTSSMIRDTAIKKVKDSKIIKSYLMKVEKEVTTTDVIKISDIKDLQDLAIFALHHSVRKQAAYLMPSNMPEAQLLKAASEISEKIEPYSIERFKKAAEQLQNSNSGLLDIVAINYPFPGVRYLARSKDSIKPKNTNNMEKLLSSKTPTQLEIKQQAEIRKCESLLWEARNKASSFLRECHNASDHGKTSHKMTIYHYSNSAKTHHEAELFKRLLLDDLHKKGFTRVSVEYKAEYSSHLEYVNKQLTTVDKLDGFSFTVYTNW